MTVTATTAAWIAAASAAAGAATTAYGAYSQNQGLKKSARAANQAATLQKSQLRSQASVEVMKREQQSQQVKSAIRASAGAAGSGFAGSSFSALSDQAEFDRYTNDAIAKQSLGFNFARVSSGLDAQLIDINNRKQNTLINAFMGGLQGLSAGMQLGQGLQGMFPAGAASSDLPTTLHNNSISGIYIPPGQRIA